jgi:hypothetical protein
LSVRRSDETYPVQAPRARPWTRWERAARKALDSWTPSAEASVAIAIEEAYVKGLRRAAAFVAEKGQPELAALVRKLAEEEPSGK